jgi:putative ABC transport system permease protein
MLLEFRAVIFSLARAKGHAVAVVLILALGLGAATAIFSMVERGLFPASSAADPATLVRISLLDPKDSRKQGPRGAHLTVYREAALPAFAGFSAHTLRFGNLVNGDQVRPVTAGAVTANHFQTLGINAALGRVFLPEDETVPTVQPVVLSDAFWRADFGADPAALGRTFVYDGQSCVVVGVLPRGFRLPGYDAAAFYLPTERSQFALTSTGATQGLSVFARLKPGATLAAAEAELRTLRPGAGLPVAKSWENLVPVVTPHDTDETSRGRDPLLHRKNWAMLGAVGLLYLIACVNAANLMLVRTLDRRREFGVRLALGASRWRVVRPILLEGGLLVFAAALLAVVVAKWLFVVLLALPETSPGAGGTLYLSARSLWVLAGLGGFSGLLLALVPLWQATRFDVHSALQSGGQSGAGFERSWLRDSFVVVQAALAIVLLISTGLMIRTCRQLLQFDPGFATQGRYLVHLSSAGALAPRTPEAQAVRARLLTEAVANVRGVRSVSIFLGSILGGSAGGIIFQVEGSEVKHAVPASYVSADYFAALGLPMVLGRGFADLPSGHAPVVVLSESLARQLFGEANPLGRRLVFERKYEWEIIGVVRDMRLPRQEVMPLFYQPLTQFRGLPASVLIRGEAELGPQFEATIRRAFYAADPKIMVQRIQRLEDVLNEHARTERSALVHLQVLGVLALVLAGFGLFAMMNYTVARRHAEFGVRCALGATDADIKGLVLGRALRLVALGLTAGIALAWYLARTFSALLYNTPALDILTNLTVVALLLAVGLLAGWLPARRATRIDLARLLRAE